MIRCKIFTHMGPETLSHQINNFLEEMSPLNIISTNMTTERTDGMDYKNVIIFYEELEPILEDDEEDLEI